MPKSKSQPDFETALAELETIVSTMEGGQLPLDATLAAYRRGVELLRHCQKTLTAAEAELELLEQNVINDRESESSSPQAAKERT